MISCILMVSVSTYAEWRNHNPNESTFLTRSRSSVTNVQVAFGDGPVNIVFYAIDFHRFILTNINSVSVVCSNDFCVQPVQILATRWLLFIFFKTSSRQKPFYSFLKSIRIYCRSWTCWTSYDIKLLHYSVVYITSFVQWPTNCVEQRT